MQVVSTAGKRTDQQRPALAQPPLYRGDVTITVLPRRLPAREFVFL